MNLKCTNKVSGATSKTWISPSCLLLKKAVAPISSLRINKFINRRTSRRNYLDNSRCSFNSSKAWCSTSTTNRISSNSLCSNSRTITTTNKFKEPFTTTLNNSSFTSKCLNLFSNSSNPTSTAPSNTPIMYLKHLLHRSCRSKRDNPDRLHFINLQRLLDGLAIWYIARTQGKRFKLNFRTFQTRKPLKSWARGGTKYRILREKNGRRRRTSSIRLTDRIINMMKQSNNNRFKKILELVDNLVKLLFKYNSRSWSHKLIRMS